MARTIYETLGLDSLIATIPNPFAFVRMFRVAEARRGNPEVFSPATIVCLDAQEKKYVRP